MAERLMTEITQGSGTEGGSVSSQVDTVQTEGRKIPQTFTEEQVQANAQLSEAERLESAEELLGPLTTTQKEALKKMHAVGSKRSGAGVFNYTREEVGEKIQKGKEAFSKEQWKALIRSGLAGRLPPQFFATAEMDPDTYNDPLVKRVITQAQTIGNSGTADEAFLDRMAANIEGGYLTGTADETEAMQALTELQQLRIYAAEPEARPRPPEDPLYPDSVRERIESETSPDTFMRTRSMYEYYTSINVNILTTDPQAAQTFQVELDNRIQALATEIHTLVEEARNLGILDDVDERTLKFYNDVKAARRQEKYGRDKQLLIDQARGRGGYQEFFWHDSPRMSQLMRTYRGVAEYIWEGIVEEINKEANGIHDDESINVVAHEQFERLKGRREEARVGEKKYETFMYYGQRNYELIAERPEELPQAVLDYVVHKIAELSRNPQSAHQKAQQLGSLALEMLETNRDFLISTERQEIPDTNPDYLRARYIAESVVDPLLTELMLYKGNMEAANSYRGEFANEFIAHHDEVYLENPFVAYLLHQLTVHRNGTYWLGQPLDTEKLSDGEMAKYRAMMEKEMKEMALAHTLFISEGDFKGRKNVAKDPISGKPILDPEGREKVVDLAYSFDDPIERLLLDPDGSIWTATEQRLQAQGLTSVQIDVARLRHDTRVQVFRDIKERNDREEGLLLTPQQMQQLEQQVQQELQQSLGRPPTAAELQAELINKVADNRKEQIRIRILREMYANNSNSGIAEETQGYITRLTDLVNQGQRGSEEFDRIMWEWVEFYNKYRTVDLKITGSTNPLADQRWFPSGWDFIRSKIDKPTKVLDRALSAEKFEAMFEPAALLANYDNSKAARKRRSDEVKFAFQLARSYQVMLMQDAMLGGMRTRLIDINTGQYTGRLMDDETSLLLGLIRERKDAAGNVIKDPVTGDVIYDVVNPNRKIIRVADIVQARLEVAIKEEADDIEQAKIAKAAAVASGDQQQIEITTKALREKLVNAQFLATHALKAKGLVEGKLPVWSHNLIGETNLDVFMKALSDYGVETADFISLGHEDKNLFYEIMERGRRGLKAEWDRVVAEHMETTYKTVAVEGDPLTGEARIDPQTGRPVLKRDPSTGELVQATSLWRAAGGYGGEKASKISRRYRMINKGGNDQNRKVVDPRFEASTSGGIRIVELIPEQMDIGLYTLLIWEGVLDTRGLHGLIHGRDEVEFNWKHSYFDVEDPINFVEALTVAHPAISGFSGGKTADGKEVPGFGQEPFHGGFKTADYLIDQFKFATDHGLVTLIQYLNLMQTYRNKDEQYSKFIDTYSGTIKFSYQEIDPRKDTGVYIEKSKQRLGTDLERYRQMSYSELDKLTKKEQDELYTTLYGVYDYFQDYLKGLKRVQTSRRGKSVRNFEEDNNKKFYDFRRKIRSSIMGKKENGVWVTKPEAGFILRRGYSPEVANEAGLRMLESVMREADYLILEGSEVARRVKDGEDLLIASLDSEDVQEGFEVKDSGGQVKRTFVIPDPKDWPKVVKPEVRKALEKIRRRGLLDFMMEEGYQLGNREILGQKVPPLVQKQKVVENSNRVMNAFDPGNTLSYNYTQD